MRGANRNDKEEDVIRGNTAPSSRRQYQPSLENNNSRNYSKIKHKSAGRQRTSSPGKTTRATATATTTTATTTTTQRRGWKKRPSPTYPSSSVLASSYTSIDGWVPPPLVPSPSPTRVNLHSNNKKRRPQSPLNISNNNNNNNNSSNSISNYPMNSPANTVSEEEDYENYENDSYDDDSFEHIDEEEPDTPESSADAVQSLLDDALTPIAIMNSPTVDNSNTPMEHTMEADKKDNENNTTILSSLLQNVSKSNLAQVRRSLSISFSAVGSAFCNDEDAMMDEEEEVEDQDDQDDNVVGMEQSMSLSMDGSMDGRTDFLQSTGIVGGRQSRGMLGSTIEKRKDRKNDFNNLKTENNTNTNNMNNMNNMNNVKEMAKNVREENLKLKKALKSKRRQENKEKNDVQDIKEDEISNDGYKKKKKKNSRRDEERRKRRQRRKKPSSLLSSSRHNVLSQVAAAATNTTTTTASSNTTANNSTKVVRQSSELMISLLSRVSGLTKTQKKALLRVLDTMEEPEQQSDQQSDQQLDPQPKATETKGIQIRTKRKTNRKRKKENKTY